MRLLLVEDSCLLQERVLEALAEYLPGVPVDTAQTQDGALTQLTQHDYGLLIADIELAQGNGFEVIRQSRALKGTQAPRVVILSNHANNHYRKLAHDLGVQHIFDKSMQFDEAMALISQLARG